MQVTLSKVEVTEIATEVVRLMKQQGLVSVAPQGENGAKGKATTSTSTKAPTKTKVAPAPAKAIPAPAGNAVTYTIATAAKAKGYHPNTVRRAIKSGRLKAKLGKDGTYQISQAAVDAFSI
jgi:hypothetical protein